MQINQKFGDHVTGTFDTIRGVIKCVQSKKYNEVELCLATGDEVNPGMNIPFAQIKLYHSELWKDADETFDEAVKLGKEIARRWNECPDKQ